VSPRRSYRVIRTGIHLLAGVGTTMFVFPFVSDARKRKLVKRWKGPKEGPILHMDSALVKDGRIYTAHSNYPEWPMTSSLEVWDAATLEHVATHSFGIESLGH